MARVRFIGDFDYKPQPMVTIGYRAGMELTVRRECADQAIAAGKAEEIGLRPRAEVATEDDDGRGG